MNQYMDSFNIYDLIVATYMIINKLLLIKNTNQYNLVDFVYYNI